MSIYNDIDPDLTSGTQLATVLNSFKDSVAAGLLATSRDANLIAGGRWIDSTTDPVWIYKLWTGATDITLMTINRSTGVITLPGSAESFTITKTGDNSLPAILEMLKKRDTGSNRTLNGDIVGEIDFTGYNNSGVKEIVAQIEVGSVNDFTSTAHGSYMRFLTTPEDGSTLTERLRLTKLGYVGIGESTPDLKLIVKSTSTTAGIGIRSGEDSDVAPQLRIRKSRVATNGQVLNDDNIGEINFHSTDQNGASIKGAMIQAKALENHTDTAFGTELILSTVTAGSASITEKLRITDTSVYFNGVLQADSMETITLLHGAVDNPLTTINSANFKAAIIEVFAHGNDGSETRATKYTIDCLWDSVNSVWIYEYEEKLMLNEALFELVFTNAATLTIEYSNNLINGTFVGGSIKMKVRRFV